MSNIDPRVGAWKLNVGKSKFSPALLALMKVTPPKDETMVYRELSPDEFEMTITGTQTDGKPIAGKSTLPRQGGVVKIQQGPFPEAVTVVATRIDSNNSYLTYMLNGKQFLLGQSVVSKNGKQMTTTIKGADPQGKPFEYVAVFDKQ
jgi:hypothetical protein